LLLALALCASAGAQIIHTDVRQVLVPVVVTDTRGHYISDLKASDFRVFEDGGQQTVIAFSRSTDPVTAAAATPISAGAAPLPAANAPRRTYLICIDTLHSAFANFAQARAALSKFFKQERSSDSQYALVALGREPAVVVDSTRNAGVVLNAIQSKKISRAVLESEAVSTAREMQQFTYFMRDDYCAKCACESTGVTADGPACSGVKARAQLSLTSFGERTYALNQNFLAGLTELVRATANMPTTRTIIFISDGFNRFPGRELYGIMDGFSPRDKSFQFNPRDSNAPLETVVKLAVRYDVKFYALDSRGLYSTASLSGGSFDASTGGAATPKKVDFNARSVAYGNTDALAQLARETGGLFFENSNDLFRGIQRAFSDGREHYVLAYSPTDPTPDGKFRKITVEVKRKGAVIHAKAGYWATSD
jgi:VWFA-related protein